MFIERSIAAFHVQYMKYMTQNINRRKKKVDKRSEIYCIFGPLPKE